MCKWSQQRYHCSSVISLLPTCHVPGTGLIVLYTLSRFAILSTTDKTAEALGVYTVLPKVTQLVPGPAEGLNPKAKLN